MKMLDRVLVIDFDEPLLVQTTALFEHYGFDVVPAGSIDDVLRALEPGAPRVIVMEPVLPERDGFELCRSILDSCVGVKPVVVLASTRIAGHEPHFRAKDVGAHMFIERPKQDEMLVQAVTTVMQAGGSRLNPAAPGRTAGRIAKTIDDGTTGVDATGDPGDAPPAPVVDSSFADWVERTFTPGEGPGGVAADALGDDRGRDDDDDLGLDALDCGEPAMGRIEEPEVDDDPAPTTAGDSLPAVVTPAGMDEQLTTTIDVSPETALAVANRAGVVVSDAMRPAPEPRSWGGIIAVGLAVVLTVGGAAAWFLLGRGNTAPERAATEHPADVASRTRRPTTNLSSRAIEMTTSLAPLETELPAIDDGAIFAVTDPGLRPAMSSFDLEPVDGDEPIPPDTFSPEVATEGAAVTGERLSEPEPARRVRTVPPPVTTVPATAEPVRATQLVETSGANTSDARADPTIPATESVATTPPAVADNAPPTHEDPEQFIVEPVDDPAPVATLWAALGLPSRWNDPDVGGTAVPEIEPPPPAKPQPAPVRPVIIEPSLLRRVAPRYPPAARRWGRGGRVMLRGTVGTDGALHDIEVVDEPVRRLGFGKAAMDAVQQWEYRPATIDGVPLERSISIEVTFRP